MGFVNYLKETARDIASDTYAMVVNRVSHGASEVAQALFTGGPAYVPYGQNSMPIAAPEVGAGDAPAPEPGAPEPEAPAADAPAAPQPAASPVEQYQAQVAMYSAMRGPSPTHQSPGL